MKLSDVSFRLKFLISPVLGVIIISFLVLQGVLATQSIKTSLVEVVDSGVKLGSVLHEANYGLKSVQADLYRLTVNVASNEDEDSGVDIDAEIGKIKDKVEAVKAYFDGLLEVEGLLSEGDVAIMDDIIISLNAMLYEVDDVTKEIKLDENGKTGFGELDAIGSMYGMGFHSAVGALEKFDVRLKNITVSVNVFLSHYQDQVDEMSEAGINQADSTKMNFMIMGIISAAALLIISLFLSQFTVKSIKAISSAAERISNSDVSVDTEALTRKDELGAVVVALTSTKTLITEVQDLLEEQKNQEEASAKERVKTLNDLADSFEEQVHGILDAAAASAEEMLVTTKGMTGAIDASGARVGQTNDAAAQTSENVQAVASAAEELSASVQEVANSVRHSTKLVENSVERTDVIDRHAIELGKATEKVGHVVGLISDISEQINLLALNATIESARAGEAGRGFAVVAAEVKNLASQTDKSIQEVQKVIGEMQAVAKDIIESIVEIKSSMGDISESSKSISISVDEQSATTREISSNMQTAATGTQTISDNLSEVRAMSDEASQSSQQALGLSQSLAEQMKNLDVQVDAFLSNLRKQPS